MRIAVTGREGQVARSLAEIGPLRGHDIVLLGRPELDLATSSAAIEEALVAARPDVIVAAAAYTAVDKAEEEPALAFAINVTGAEAVARAAKRIGAPLIHLSTDYVFGGVKHSPYLETDETGPRSVYGTTKCDGERVVLDAHADSVILRTAWVFSPFGSNFVKTMLRLAETRDEIGVVADQRGNPTSALDIAGGIIDVAANLQRDPGSDLRGIFHLTSRAELSWADFAEVIFASSAARGGPTATVRPISTADYPTRAVRPANSRLDSVRIEKVHGIRLADWRQSVDAVIARLVTSL